jgi:5-methylthioadenosine/S-adenosylhomocysteine deaminase
MARTTLYTADWIVPVSEPPMVQGGLLVGADGRIESVAPISSFAESADVARVNLGAAIIMPGLINVHAHPELAMFRGFLEDLPFHQWIPTLMKCKRAAALDDDDYAVAARWTCIESLRAGITTFGATEDSGVAVAALNAAGMRGLIYLEVFGPDPRQADDSMQQLRSKVESLAPSATDQVRIGVSPHAPYTVSDELYSNVAAFAKSERLSLATHAAEAEAESILVSQGKGPFAAGLRTRGIETPPRARSTIELLQRTGVLECAPLIIHAVLADADDLQMLADHGATIAHCPIANARLGHGIAPIVEAKAAGINVAIGSDSVGSNNRIDLLEEARVAQILQRARLRSASALTSAELLRMVTINAASALGMSDEIGSLEPGKSADFCVVAVDGAHTQPVYDPVGSLFHAARGSDVTMTVVAGRVLYERDRVQTLPEASLRAELASISNRLRMAVNAQ